MFPVVVWGQSEHHLDRRVDIAVGEMYLAGNSFAYIKRIELGNLGAKSQQFHPFENILSGF